MHTLRSAERIIEQALEQALERGESREVCDKASQQIRNTFADLAKSSLFADGGKAREVRNWATRQAIDILANTQATHAACSQIVAKEHAATESASEYWSLEDSRRYNSTDGIKQYAEDLFGLVERDVISSPRTKKQEENQTAQLLALAMQNVGEQEIDWQDVADFFIPEA